LIFAPPGAAITRIRIPWTRSGHPRSGRTLDPERAHGTPAQLLPDPEGAFSLDTVNSSSTSPSRRATLIASLTELPAGDDWSRLPPQAEVLEVRADLVGDLDPDDLRAKVGGRTLLYTLRSQEEGGGCASSPARRAERLAAAAAGYDWIDIEADRDRDEELLARVAPERRILSWHGDRTSLSRLNERFERMARTPARYYKLIPAARRSGDELAPLTLLHSLARRDVIAFASGPIGLWSRLVAPRLGAPVVYGASGFGPPAAAGQPTVAALCRDYGLPELRPASYLCGVVGNPVAHSLSPRLHNAGYRAAGVDALYVPFHAERFSDFWLNVVESTALPAFGLPITGLSVTAPFKDAALAVAAGSSPLAKLIGAANTLVYDGPPSPQPMVEGHGWSAEATDPEGVVGPLRAHGVELAGVPVVVIGAGGAGRAAAVALREAGAQVTLANRSEDKGRRAARELHIRFAPLAGLDLGAFAVVVHATSLGRDAAAPVDVAALAPAAVLVDLVYNGTTGAAEPTALVAAARARDIRAVDGREVLLYQALAQFRAMTGRELDIELGRQCLDLAPALAALPPEGTPE
jgi:3-dehydroquinate dehydratase/shikimate dehydrogenase